MNLLADMGAQPQTLIPGLVAAAASTDTTPPTSVITSPTAGTAVHVGQPTVITGTATDAGGGVVAGIEISTDGGATWSPVDGTDQWSYTWVPAAAGPTTIQVRATDDSANLETPGPGVTVTVG